MEKQEEFTAMLGDMVLQQTEELGHKTYAMIKSGCESLGELNNEIERVVKYIAWKSPEMAVMIENILEQDKQKEQDSLPIVR